MIAVPAPQRQRVLRLGALPALLIGLLAFSGCATPVNPALWNPRPQVVIVTENLEFEHQGVGKFLVPQGEYTYWYSNKLGHYYNNDTSKIRCTYKPVFGEVKTDSFQGGIWLSNRVDAVLLYEISTVEKDSKLVGEIAHMAAWEAGDKDGFARNWRGEIPRYLREKLKFKSAPPATPVHAARGTM